MKKILPIIFALLFFSVTIVSPIALTHAQSPAPTGGLWVVDPEVTFIGKNAARSGYVLNWTLLNYQWACVIKVAERNCDNTGNPLQQFWWTIVLYIVSPLLILVVLATSMVIIISRGKSLTIMRFLPRFTAVLILIVLSYALLQFLYQFADLIQGFFLRSGTASCPPACIQDSDLLYVGWRYQDFVGLRLLGDYNAESAFISLLLTKLTALTYFVMVGILLIRKIILWFFIIVSPIFPLLLLFYPVRNTGKIWIGEFFRWLLYGPLFAIFLQGLVFMWRGGNGNGAGIPLQFTPANNALNDANQIIYPTAVNILLGGPRQFVTPTNSINLTETFMLYVVALIMLWIVILLPWILLQIFLDYATQFSGDNAMMKNLVAIVSNKMVPPTSPMGHPPASGGTAMTLPFSKKSVNIPILTTPIKQPPTGAAKELTVESAGASIGIGNANVILQQGQAQSQGASTFTMPLAQVNAEVISFSNIPLPTMRDIARYDSAFQSNNSSQREEVVQMQQMLEKIANPAEITSTVERERYQSMSERLVKESQQGNIIATTILNAINSAANNRSSRMSQSNLQASDSHLKNVLQQIANPALTSNLVDRSRMSELHQMLSKESKENNNQLATSILSVTDKTTATELDKIREELVKDKATAGSVASAVSNTVRATQIKSVLQQVASPASITNPVEREKMSKLHDMIARESKENNNQLATSILQVKDTTTQAELEKISEKIEQTKESAMSSQLLSTINSSLQKAQNTERTKSVLQQMANPASITSPVEREKMTKLHDMLAKESKENNNQLATSILQVKDITTQSELEKISEKLEQTKDSAMSSQVLSTINSNLRQSENISKTKSVLQQIANPSQASTIDKERMNKLHESLTKESQKGSELATSLLAVNKSTSVADVQKLSEKLNDARQKGVPLAAEVLDLAQKQIDIPSSNRIQTVTPEELAEVKNMWKENYAKMDVPEGMAGTRSEWVKDDIEKINNLTSLLTSNNQEKIDQGLSEVANILPFLLVGGFSQAEIVSYLQTKQEAAKEVLQSMTVEEESKVEVTTKQAVTAQTMAVNVETPSVSISTPSVTTSSPIITPQVSNEILAMVDLKIPRMRDVARFDSMSISRDKSQTGEVQKVRETLERIANPASATVSTERTKFEKLRERLMDENQKGNATAGIVLNAATGAMQKAGVTSIQSSDIKTVLAQITNPSSVSSESEREAFTKLHDTLISESKDKKNELASAILTVNDTTSNSQLEKVREQLERAQASGNSFASSVMSTVNQSVQNSKTKQVLQQISNPASISSPVDRERMTKLHDAIQKESQKGNELATSLLSVNKSTSSADIEKLSQKLKEQQIKGESVAQSVMQALPQTVSLPATNRVQTVTPEELAEVKNMWKENYAKMDVPEGMAGTRSEWVKDDIEKINNLTSLLTSNNQEKIDQGLSEVANILPFLLVGGFSQAEIVSYLQTKQEAAKEVLQSMTVEEESKVEVTTKQAVTAQTMAVNVETPSVSISTPSVTTSSPIITPQVSNEILAMVDLKIPRMRDVARFDSMSISRDKSQTGEVQKVRETLERIANPASATASSEKEKFDQLRQKLVQESQKGNITADMVLNAASGALSRSTIKSISNTDIKSVLAQIVNPAQVTSESDREAFSKLHEILLSEKDKKSDLANALLTVNDTTSNSQLEKVREQLERAQASGNSFASSVMSTVNQSVQNSKIRQVLQQIANPNTVSSPADKERMNKLHGIILKSSQEGSDLASSVLKVNQTTPNSEIDKIRLKLKEAQMRGEAVGNSVSEVLPQAVNIPSSNRIQTVTPEELAEVKNMWKENYAKMDVPEGMAGTRSEWVKDDIEKINNLTSLLTSNNQEKIDQGLSEVANILPFLLVGGFSQAEIVSYLQTKQEAAKEVLQSMTVEEESKVEVTTKQAVTAQTMAVNVETPSVSISTPSVTTSSPIITPQVSNEILAMVDLKIPRMRDVVRYEAMSLSRDKSKMSEIQKAQDILKNLANPMNVQIPAERQNIERLRERLIEESQKGNNTAETILTAAMGTLPVQALAPISIAEFKKLLEQIAKPELCATDDEKEQYKLIHDKLEHESRENSNELSTTILKINESTEANDIEKIRTDIAREQQKGVASAQELVSIINNITEVKQTREILSQIANPASISSAVNKERFAKLNEKLVQGAKSGDQLAQSILDVKPITKSKDIEKLKRDLSDSLKKGNALAKPVLSVMNSSTVPADNRIQIVKPEDYDEVEKMWEENYRTMPVPSGFNDDVAGRIKWIEKEIEEIQATLELLLSTDADKKAEGLKKVGTILPFLLLGGFSLQEIIDYLEVKLQAAKVVLAELKVGETEKVNVDVDTKKEEKKKTMTIDDKDENKSH